MNKKILIIISQRNFFDEEYHKTRAIFESLGSECKVASSRLNPAVGMEGSFVKPDFQISNINVKDYSAICLIGCVGCTVYWHDKVVHNLVIEVSKEGLLLAASLICTGVSLVGFAHDKNATSFTSFDKRVISWIADFPI